MSPGQTEFSKRVESVCAATLLLQGKPWVHRGRGPEAYDCVGLIKAGYEAAGLHLSGRIDYSPHGDGKKLLEEVRSAGFVRREGDARRRPGIQAADLLLFFTTRKRSIPHHCGIALNERFFVHCENEIGVTQDDINVSYHRRIHSVWYHPWLRSH